MLEFPISAKFPPFLRIKVDVPQREREKEGIQISRGLKLNEFKSIEYLINYFFCNNNSLNVCNVELRWSFRWKWRGSKIEIQWSNKTGQIDPVLTEQC